MKNWAKIVLVVGLALIVMGIYLGVTCEVQSYKYSGRLAFQTEVEYTQFKQYIADNPKIKISHYDNIYYLTILSSNSPIIIDYSMGVPADIEFPYEYVSRTGLSVNTVGIVVGSVFGAAVIIMIIISYSIWQKR